MTEQAKADSSALPCPPLADLCDGDPLDLEADPRLRLLKPAPPEPCGPLCTPWCLASHA